VPSSFIHAIVAIVSPARVHPLVMCLRGGAVTRMKREELLSPAEVEFSKDGLARLYKPSMRFEAYLRCDAKTAMRCPAMVQGDVST
jgi:hypothetical protein